MSRPKILSDIDSLTKTVQNISAYVISATAPADTKVIWIDTANKSVAKYYSGTEWVIIPSVWG